MPPRPRFRRRARRGAALLMSAPLLAGALLTAPAIAAAPAPQSPQADPGRADAVDELMARYARSDAPGAVIGVVRGGELIFARGYGMASLEQGTRLTTESILDVGSVSKQMTAYAVVLLAQRGTLGLDDDVRRWIPEMPDFGSTITVRHLVHHVSGLREIYDAAALAGYQGGDGLSQPDALHLTRRMRELNFAPGSEYLYCNTGYMLLADVVARVSGMPFPEFMEREVFRPLGMNRTTIMAERGQVIPGAAESYRPMGDGGDGGGGSGFARVFDNSGIQGAGGVYTTVGDLARWMAALSGRGPGGATAVDRMKERGVLTGGDTLPYAFGINVTEYRGLEMMAHTGSSAGYRASIVYFPELDAAVIRQSNRSDFDASIPMEVAELFFGDAMEPAVEEPEATEADGSEAGSSTGGGEGWSPTDDELRAFAGRWFSPELETVYTLVVEGGALVATHRRHEDAELEPREPDVFRGGVLGTVRFERDAAGAVAAMRVTTGRVRNLLFQRMED